MASERETIASALPGYEVGDEIGRGAWGIVLEGTHRQLARRVAIKQLPRAFGADEAVRSRFLTEARLLASLDHPHIVPVFDYVEEEGLCLLVMEWLPGGTVWDRFTRAGVTPPGACAIVLAACAGLHFAHQRGVLHRDVKPENLIFNAEGTLKVSDFGIAKVITGSEAGATRAGEVLGTPAYMAPEQARGGELGPYTDVYATGTMLYELLCGQLPFPEGNDPLALMFQHVYEEPLPIRGVAPQLSEELAEVTMQSLSVTPDARYPTAEGFGVAVAEAATATWGPGWLEAADLQIMSSGPILAAAQRPTAPVTASAGTRTAQTRAVPAAPAMRPTAFVRPEGVSALDRRPEDVVPLKEVVVLPAPPRVQTLAALVLLLASAAVAFFGIGKPSRSQDLPAGTVTIAGVDPVSTDPIRIDLSQPIPVSVAPVPPGARQVQLGFSIAGVPIRSFQAGLDPSGGGATASIDAGSGRFLLAGEITGELRFLSEGTVVARQAFAAESEQPFYLTAPGVAGIVLALFVFAYAEALLRPMRRGKKQLTGLGGLIVLGGLGGVAIQILIWLTGGTEPTLPAVIACAVLGAGAGIAAGLAAIRVGKRRRLRRKKSKAEAA